MPRVARALPQDTYVHVVTRGNARASVFHAPGDYAAFVELFAWCLMPNHLHLVARPRALGALGKLMHWLLTTHVQRYRARRGVEGRIWQGRYKTFPIQADRHFITVLRYVERNPVRAELVPRSRDWAWSSVHERVHTSADRRLLSPSPVELPSPWPDWVDEPLTGPEILRLRESVRRSRPFGDDEWVRATVDDHDLHWTTRARGRQPSPILRKSGT